MCDGELRMRTAGCGERQDVCVGAALDRGQGDVVSRHINAKFAFLALAWFCVGSLTHFFVTLRDRGNHQRKRVVLNCERDYAANMAIVVHLILVRVGTQRNNHKGAILPYFTNGKTLGLQIFLYIRLN